MIDIWTGTRSNTVTQFAAHRWARAAAFGVPHNCGKVGFVGSQRLASMLRFWQLFAQSLIRGHDNWANPGWIVSVR